MVISLNQKILEIFSLLLWGILFIKYWMTGQLSLLIHPNYFILVLITGICFLILALIKLGLLWQELRRKTVTASPKIAHLNVLPQNLGSTLLIVTALSGLLIQPKVLTSQMALQRGVRDSLPLTTEQPQAFVISNKPERRSLIEWVRTLNAYPEPDNYRGQKAKISGFVVHLPALPENYLYLSRFILTCCAVDAYPVGIPVKLPDSRSNYPRDSWLEVEGEMMTETLPNLDSDSAAGNGEKRQLVLNARVLKPIPTPSNPYEY